jgi:predicted N-acetyltransferase YhbS
MRGISIQELTEDKLQETIEVTLRAFGEDERENSEIDFPATFLNMPRPYSTLIALHENKVIGAVQCMYSYLGIDMHNILWVCVDPTFQGKGVGTKIMQSACQHIETHFLKGKKGTIFLTAESGAEKLYQKFGFKIISTCHDGNPAMMKIVEGK